MTYRFMRRTLNLPEGIERDQTFEAASMLDALQQASDYWFGGEIVNDSRIDSNGVVTLLSASQAGNVIGSVMLCDA